MIPFRSRPNGSLVRADRDLLDVKLSVDSFVLEHQIDAGAFENAIAVSEVLLRRELAGKYTRMEDIPADLKVKADRCTGRICRLSPGRKPWVAAAGRPGAITI